MFDTDAVPHYLIVDGHWNSFNERRREDEASLRQVHAKYSPNSCFDATSDLFIRMSQFHEFGD